MSKVLGAESCERFYKIRDALADYAYEKLDIEGRLYTGTGKKYSGENQYREDTLCETLDEAWRTPEVLDAFIEENPAALNASDLTVLRNWKNHVQGWFILFMHENRLLFLSSNELFEVSGLWDQIEMVLNRRKFPLIVETTLLPFEGRIVYHGFLSEMPVSMGEGFRSMLESEIREALKDPHIISGADELIQIAPIIRERQSAELAKQAEQEAAFEEEGRKQMHGFHEGILSGLSEEERKEAIHRHIMDSIDLGSHDHAVSFIKGGLTKGRATRDLQKLLEGEGKEILRRWALILGVEVPGRGTKADLIKGLLPVIRSNAFLPELTLREGFSLDQFEAYRSLYEAGGTMDLRESEISTLRGVPVTTRLLCYSFYTKGSSEGEGKFSFVIPEDIMGVLNGLDWDEIREHIVAEEAAADIADACVGLRGIVKTDEAFEEFCRLHPSALDWKEFDEVIADAINKERIGCVWLEADDGNDYLLDYDIAGYYRDVENPEDRDERYESDYMEDSFLRGSLEPLEFILDQRKDKKIRHLEENMLSSMEIYDWKCARPAVRALRDYLDSHVPDSQDDYYYADAVIEDLVDYMSFGIMQGGATVNEWMQILEEHDFFPNEAHFNRVMGLLMNMHNSLPSWLNNGWAPNELTDMKLGRKSYYNEDGSRMKVGRNDPCPCGSGKKYKNCCGKRT